MVVKMYQLRYYLIFLGLAGVVYNRSNLVLYFLCMEIILLGVNVIFILSSLLLGDVFGFIVYFFILTISASEVALGLSLLVSYYISYLDISVNYMRLVRW